MVGLLREKGDPSPRYGADSDEFSLVVHHGQRLDYFDYCNVDTMSMFEIVNMVERLGNTTAVTVFWKVSDRPLELKKLMTDYDVLEMVGHLPTDHYMHVHLREIGVHNEPEMSVHSETRVEPETRVEFETRGDAETRVESETRGDAESRVHSETRLDSDSNSEDEEFLVESDSSSHNSDFSDSETEVLSSETERCSGNLGLGSDQVQYESDNDSGKSDSLHSVDESDSDGPKQPRFLEFNSESDLMNPKLKVGQLFASKDILKDAIKMYGIKNRYSVKLKRNDNRRIQAKCKGECQWMLWAAPIHGEDPSTGTWQIRSIIGEHSCLREFKNSNCTAKWLAKNYFSSFFVDPNFSSASLKEAVHKDWGLVVDKGKCIRAKNVALENLNGNYNEQYANLYAYLGELRHSNPGTTTVCKLDERKFERVYICMQALKDGFKAGCRPIVGLDGCHLKGYYKGHLLAAVGIDANDAIYPIAFAVVESENQASWFWFLELLATDLEMENSHSYTFMTDRQKGLMEAVSEVFPHAAHRTCVRHLYSNAKSSGTFGGKAVKDQLWKAARATYPREFQSCMDELKVLSETAWKWLSPKDPTNWSKSHFSFGCKSDMLLNNNCECFNKLILEARDKPIITCLESIRSKLMQRLAKKKDESEKWTGLLCPKIQKKLEHATSSAHSCWPLYAGGHMYQVSCGPSTQHSVNIQQWTCTCRKWQLTGIPCVHAISVILSIEDRPERYVDSCYFSSTQRAIYSHLICPVRGEKQWEPVDTLEPVLPPVFRRPPGRPHKKRRKESDETPSQAGRLSRRGIKIVCKRCNSSGHNIRTCKGKVGANPRRHGQAYNGVAARKNPITPKLPVRRPEPVHPSQPTTVRWMPTTGGAGTSQGPSPTPSQPSQPTTVRWMPTTGGAGTSQGPSPTPSQPSEVTTMRWMPTPRVPTTQESSYNPS